jgi:TPR repeat protein
MEKSASRLHAPAQCRLGYYYAKGIGVEQNTELAEAWYLKAFEHRRNQDAAYLLACLYFDRAKENSDFLTQYEKWIHEALWRGQKTLGITTPFI